MDCGRRGRVKVETDGQTQVHRKRERENKEEKSVPCRVFSQARPRRLRRKRERQRKREKERRKTAQRPTADRTPPPQSTRLLHKATTLRRSSLFTARRHEKSEREENRAEHQIMPAAQLCAPSFTPFLSSPSPSGLSKNGAQMHGGVLICCGCACVFCSLRSTPQSMIVCNLSISLPSRSSSFPRPCLFLFLFSLSLFLVLSFSLTRGSVTPIALCSATSALLPHSLSLSLSAPPHPLCLCDVFLSVPPTFSRPRSSRPSRPAARAEPFQTQAPLPRRQKAKESAKERRTAAVSPPRHFFRCLLFPFSSSRRVAPLSPTPRVHPSLPLLPHRLCLTSPADMARSVSSSLPPPSFFLVPPSRCRSSPRRHLAHCRLLTHPRGKLFVSRRRARRRPGLRINQAQQECVGTRKHCVVTRTFCIPLFASSVRHARHTHTHTRMHTRTDAHTHRPRCTHAHTSCTRATSALLLFSPWATFQC